MLNANNSRAGSWRESTSISSWLANAATPWRKRAGREVQSVRPVFVGEWRKSDEVCSVVLAQSSDLSARYRGLFLLDAAKFVDPSIGTELRNAAEEDASVGQPAESGMLGEVAVVTRMKSGVVVGIENAQPEDLVRKSQLRYHEYLRLRNSDPMLMMAIPQASAISNEKAKTLDRFETICCGHFSGWVDGCLADWLGYMAPELESILRNVMDRSSDNATSERNVSNAMRCSPK